MDRIRIVICVMAFTLAGCTSAPKQALPDSEYQTYAARIVAVSLCGRSGQLAPDVASLGLTYVRSDLDTYSWDQARMRTFVDGPTWPQPSTAECNQMAMMIHGRKQQIDRNLAAGARTREQSEALLKATEIKPPVYCHSNGVQVVCN